MPLETATNVSDLVASNPAASDPMAGADDHIRLIKATLKTTLAHTGQLTNTDNQLIPADGTSTKPAYAFASEPTLGFRRFAAGVAAFVGGKLSPKNIIPTGSVHMFVALPASIGIFASDTGKDWLELNGQTYNRSDYPDLADIINGVGVGSTFTLPNMTATGRFPRSRIPGTTAVGTAQANTVGPHTHPDVTPTTGVESTSHTHAFSGTTGNDSPDHTHGGVIVSGNNYNSPGGATIVTQSVNGGSTGGASTRHQHPFSGTTGGQTANHTHQVTVSTPANTGTTETRPEALSFVFAVKT